MYMYYIMTILLFIIFISSMIMNISMLFSKKKKNDLEKMSPFECGFDPISSTRMPFSLQFYLITIIFLIFDIELALLIPMVKTFFMSNLITWMNTSIILILILLMGIYYEWNQGALNWS